MSRPWMFWKLFLKDLSMHNFDSLTLNPPIQKTNHSTPQLTTQPIPQTLFEHQHGAPHRRQLRQQRPELRGAAAHLVAPNLHWFAQRTQEDASFAAHGAETEKKNTGSVVFCRESENKNGGFVEVKVIIGCK